MECVLIIECVLIEQHVLFIEHIITTGVMNFSLFPYLSSLSYLSPLSYLPNLISPHLCLAPYSRFPHFRSTCLRLTSFLYLPFPLSYINPVDYACKTSVYSLIATTVEDSGST